MLDSVRVRLTLWHVGVLALVLVVFSISVYALLARSLYARLDDDLRTTLQETGISLGREVAAGEPEAKAAADVLDEHIGPRQAAAIFDEHGQLLADNPALSGLHAQLPTQVSATSEPQLYTTASTEPANQAGRRVAVERIVLAKTGKAYVFVISQPLDVVTNELRTIRYVLGVAVLVALGLAGFGGWFLAQHSLAPIVEMTARAQRISAENLEQRLPLANPRDELGRLAATFNELLARLDDSFAQQRRFMADASHELRTPISVLRTATGVTLEQAERNVAEYREALKVIDEQARRLTRIVEDMFMLARADAGERQLQQHNFDLGELLWEAARAAEVLATRKGVELDIHSLPQTPYRGDEGLLRQMLLNLLDNAIKHTPPGGRVRVELERLPAAYAIIVADTGSGIPAEAHSHIFERFYRVDKARSRTSMTEINGGAGLGLAIAKWIAEAHDGRLELQSSGASGTTFVASLPVAHGR
jgi:heavy metal sensor kinase